MSHPRAVVNFPPFTIHCYSELGSTNDLLKQWADAPEFTSVVADQQTAGRGRRDRLWHSSPGDGLYLSILLRPPSSSTNIPLLSLMAAVAVAETMISREIPGVDIKWPNDVLLNERKVCGILAEGASAGSDEIRIILGIGVNINHSSFPSELRETATSLFIETERRADIGEVRDQLLERIGYWYGVWRRDEFTKITGRWQELSSYAKDQKVAVTLDRQQLLGVTDGLTAAGALRLQTTEGELKTIIAGEVTRLRKHE